jgi:phage terminase large subunit
MELSDSSINVEELNPQSDFLKISVNKYTDLIGLKLIKPQIGFVNALNDPRYRFITAALSRRTGKSLIANIVGHLISLIPGTNVLIISPNYNLSMISWDLQKNFLKKFDIELERSNAKDKVIELSNGSSVRMGSVSQADSVVGRSYNFIIFDEAALDDKGADVFEVQLRPTLDRPTSKAVFISTPRGRNWFYDYWLRGFDQAFPTWFSMRSTWRDNPRVSEVDIADAQRTLSRAMFQQEYECSFNAYEGLIYDFSFECINEDPLSFLEPPLDFIMGIDLGFRDPTAMVVIATDGKNFAIVDEYLDSGKPTRQYAAACRALANKYNTDYIYIDSAAAQTRYDFAFEYDISTINAKKSISDGIGYVSSLVDNKRIYVHPRCNHVIAMFNNSSWDTREGVKMQQPKHDKYSHMNDAVRYALYSHSANAMQQIVL